MAAPGAFADQTDAQQARVREISKKQAQFEKIGAPLRNRWNQEYRQYRNAERTLKNIADSRGTRDGAVILQSEKRQWGEPLAVPVAYGVIETIVPRAVSNMPRVIVRPNDEGAVDAAEKVSKVFNRQQEQIDLEMTLQSIARSGFLYGLGVGKTYWDTRSHDIVQRGFLTTKTKTQTDYAGPCTEWVDVPDFFWDPNGLDIKHCDWVIHRAWRPWDYVAKMVNAGKWNKVDLEAAKGLSSENAKDAVWKDRMQAQGLSAGAFGRLHEVWEYHDGQRVVTILDRQLLMQDKPNPFDHREIPFQIFRPTIIPGEFCGMSEIRPLLHLIYELQTLRGQRRDNATLVNQRPFFYQEGSLPRTPVWGPAIGNPTWGPPQDNIFFPPISDIPASGYQESSEIKEDIQTTAGISDALAGADQGANQATATGTQMILEAANTRIKLKTRNLARETVKSIACQYFYLNRQFAPKEQTVRIDTPAAGEQGYEFVTITKADWLKSLDLIPDADSMQPDNTVQRRNDAITLYQALQSNQAVDQGKNAVHLLEDFDIGDAEAWVAQQQAPGPDPAALLDLVGKAIQQAGVAPDQQNAIETAIQQNLPQLQQQGGQPAPPTTNGATPTPQGAAY